MNACQFSKEYEKRLDEFLQFAFQNEKTINGTYYNPYVCCLN